MPDSNPSDRPGPNREQIRRERLDGIKRWVEYIREHPPEVWGPQQNRLVNTQLESARETGLSPEHERRVTAFGAAVSDEDPDEEPSP